MLFISLLFSTFERSFYKFCHLMKSVCIIQFVFHIIEAYSLWKLLHNLLCVSAPCQMADNMPRVYHYHNRFSNWKETVNPPEETAYWASGWLILRRLGTYCTWRFFFSSFPLAFLCVFLFVSESEDSLLLLLSVDERLLDLFLDFKVLDFFLQFKII